MAQWRSGDAVANGAADVVAGLGFVFPLDVPPGVSQLLIRAETSDPLVVPVRLETPAEALSTERELHYGYGLLYGFLLALIAFNAMLHAGLRSGSYLRYAGYLLSFVALNLCYTGHAFAWFWPQAMVWLGFVTLSRGQLAGRYFFAAAVCGMSGVGATTLCVWGWIPMNTISYHGIETGIAVEATLLALALASRMREHLQARQDAEQLARTDPLTDLPNRRAFLERARAPWSVAQRGRRPLAALVLDIDHFKAVNYDYGHEVGDRVLVHLAALMRAICRAGDLPARWGGEEFVMLLPETDLTQALGFGERLRTAVEQTPAELPDGRCIAFTASLGVAELNGETDTGTLERLIAHADQALYRAKSGGRNQVLGPA